MKKRLVFVVIIVIVVTFIVYICLIQNNKTQDTTLSVKDILIDITYNPDDPSFFWYDMDGKKIPIMPDRSKHRLIKYSFRIMNIGRKNKNFVIAEVILVPAFEEKILHGSYTSLVPLQLQPDKELTEQIYFLAEGAPEELRELAYQSTIRIVWEEDGEKREKIVPVQQAE
jgi:hypothetical protein